MHQMLGGVLLLFGPAGCGDVVSSEVLDGGEQVEERLPLVDNNLWAFADIDSDPFVHERPASVNCPEWAYAEEFGTFEVDTGSCNYLSVTQPSLAPIKEGDTIHISLWHDVLLADEPGEGHAALAIGGDIIWEATFEIPSYPNAYSPHIVSEKSYSDGTPVAFHLHNHGSNNWRLLSVSVE